tara:strand:- start:27 stop:320 length:294 start_codon:yes stop_codon:yes gene_type:complete
MHYIEVEEQADLCLKFKLIDSDKHYDVKRSIWNNKKDEKELEKIYKSLPKISDSTIMRIELSRIASNSKLIANIMVFYLVIGILTAFIYLQEMGYLI